MFTLHSSENVFVLYGTVIFVLYFLW